MTHINKDGSFNNNGSSDLTKIPHDPLTHDPYDPDKNKNFQVEKSKTKPLKIGDRVRIKSPHFLAGKTGKVLYINPNDPNTQVTVGDESWAVNQGFKFTQLEIVK